MPNVAGSKEAWPIRFQIVGSALERPVLPVIGNFRRIRAGQNVTFRIAGNSCLDRPFRVGYTSEAKEQPCRINDRLSMRLIIRQGNRPQEAVSM